MQSLTDAITKRGRLRWLFTLPAHVQQTQSCCPGLAAHRLSRRLVEEAGVEEAASGGAPKATLADCGHRARPSKILVAQPAVPNLSKPFCVLLR